MKKYVAEFIGTFTLVFCGAGAAIINDVTGGTVTQVGIGITFGVVVMLMIFVFGSVSGAHINPAVTISLWVSGNTPRNMVFPYILAQMMGAILASGVLALIFPTGHGYGMTLPAGSPWQSFFLEIVLTFILMLVIFVAANNKSYQHAAGGIIGSVVMMEAIFAGPICGASMNPARSFGPAVIAGDFTHLWVYLFAPCIGALMSIIVWKIIKENHV